MSAVSQLILTKKLRQNIIFVTQAYKTEWLNKLNTRVIDAYTSRSLKNLSIHSITGSCLFMSHSFLSNDVVQHGIWKIWEVDLKWKYDIYQRATAIYIIITIEMLFCKKKWGVSGLWHCHAVKISPQKRRCEGGISEYRSINF